MDRSKLAGEIAEPPLKARGTKLDLPLDERHQHHRRAETHIIGCVGDEPGRQQTGPLRLHQRGGLVRCQIGLICEPLSIVKHAQHEPLGGGIRRALDEEHRRRGRALHLFDVETPSRSANRPAQPLVRVLVESEAQASSLRVHRRQSNFGTSTSRPPAIADSCAQMPAAVQLAAVTASIHGCLSLDDAADELVNHVRVRPVVAAALLEREVALVFAVDEPLCVAPDRGRQQVGAIRRLRPRHGLRALLSGDNRTHPKQHGMLILHLPFVACVLAIHGEALHVGSGAVEQGTRHLGAQPRRLKLIDRRLDGIGIAVWRAQLLAHLARPETVDPGCSRFRQRQQRAHGVCGVPHGRQSGPIGRPPLHVLIVRSPKKLDAAELPPIPQLLGVDELPGVDRGLHHHVGSARSHERRQGWTANPQWW